MDSKIKIPGYRIDSMIGKGGMATVYVATQESLARTVALKIMDPSMLADPSSAERFLKEGKIVARLNHSNIVTVYDIGNFQSVFYMAMEYIQGGNLSERIQSGLPVKTALNITRQIAEALGYAHKRGFIHRDVKPANILFKEDDTTVLSDFGIAKAVSSGTRLTITGQAIGTPEYMSPEQVSGESMDSRSDLYSLGVVLFEMLTQQRPFKGEDPISTAMKHMVAPLPKLPVRLSHYQQLFDSLCAKDPNERFSTADHLIRALDELLGKATPTIYSSSTAIASPAPETIVKSDKTESSAEDGWTRTLRWAAILTVLIISVGIVLFLWQRAHRIDPQTRMIINMLLNQAEQQLATSRLLEPDGDNAYQNYRNVLELEPHNQLALDGLEKIANSFEAQALVKQQQELFEEGLTLVDQGLKASPRHSGLLELQQKLNQQLDERYRWERVALLLSQAEQQLAASRLTTPPGNNALETYRAILEFDQWNRQALNGLWEIANRLEKQAIDKQQQGLFEEGLTLINKGLQIDPQHKNLIALQNQLTEQLQEQQRQRKLKHLIAQAKRQLNSSQIVDPRGDNAYETYRSVLKIDPNNSQALAGLQQIAEHFEKKARTKQQQYQLEEGLALTKQGLKIVPQHSGLRSLQEEMNQQLAEMRKQRKVAQLLSQAERQISDSQWIEPLEDNAHTTYRQILKLDPGNKRAQAGLSRLATLFQKVAIEHQTKGELLESLAAINHGLQMVPGHVSLQDLRSEIQAQLDKRELRRHEIDRLLAEAQRQETSAKLIEPATDNAYSNYRQVLKLDPQNATALAGLERVATWYERSARGYKEEGAFEQSLELIERGLLAFPKHKGLDNLHSQVREQLEEKAHRQRKIQHLLSQAERQLNAMRLTRPEHDNAYASYSKVLNLDPNNARAQAGLKQIAAHYEQIALRQISKDELQQALDAIDLGLRVQPDYPALQALRSKTKEQMQVQEHQRVERERQQQRIQQLLTQAKRQFRISQLIDPPGDNAFESFRQIQKLDPMNHDARKGLEKIGERIERLALSEQRKGQLEKSQALTSRALQVFPGHPGLLALDAELAQERAVQSLLEKAERQIASSQLTQPEGDNAYESFRAVLAIAPRNHSAMKGLQTLGEHYEYEANQARESGRLKDALLAVTEGIKAVPDHSGLLELEKKIYRQLDEKEHQYQTLSDLLADAQAHLSASRYTKPVGSNAYETFKKMLALDPNNTDAITGISELTRRIEQRAKEKQRDKDYNQSLSLIEEALTIQPQRADLGAFFEEVTQQREKQHQKTQIATLLARAEQQFTVSHWIRPKGNNAYESYQQVLELSPQNQRALVGLQHIADGFLQRGQTELEKGNLNKSLASIDEGLRVAPEHAGLLALRGEVNQQITEQKQLGQLEDLFAKAEQQLAAYKLTQPSGDNAFESYTQILELSPRQARALKGIQQVADRYLDLGQAKFNKGELGASLAMIERGLEVVSEHPGLLKLRDETQRKLKLLRTRQEELQALLNRARRQFKTNKITRPKGNNAYETYLNVLAIDAGNQRAKAGLQKIAEYYESLARSKQDSGALREGLTLAVVGLEVDPHHLGLLNLQKEIQDALEKRQGIELKVKKLLSVAQEKLEAGQSTQPKGNNAVELYQEVLRLEPQNPLALKGLKDIAENYEERAWVKQRQGKLQEGLLIVEEGLKILPMHDGLLSLKSSLTHQLKKEHDQNKQDKKPGGRIFGTF